MTNEADAPEDIYDLDVIDGTNGMPYDDSDDLGGEPTPPPPDEDDEQAEQGADPDAPESEGETETPEAKAPPTEGETEELSTEKVKEITSEMLQAEQQRIEAERREKAIQDELAGLRERLEAQEKELANPLAAAAKRAGVSEQEFLLQINKSFLSGQMQPTTPQDVEKARIDALERQLKEEREAKEQAAVQAQKTQLFTDIRGAVELKDDKGEEKYPFSTAYSPDGVAQLVTDQIWEHYQEKGDVRGLDVHKMLQEQEDLLFEDLKKLTSSKRVLARLGLVKQDTAKSQSEQNDSSEADASTLKHSDSTATIVVEEGEDGEGLSDQALLEKSRRRRKKVLEDLIVG